MADSKNIVVHSGTNYRGGGAEMYNDDVNRNIQVL